MDAEMYEGGVGVITSVEPSVDVRILGTYDGDGSLKAIEQYDPKKNSDTDYLVAITSRIGLMVLSGLGAGWLALVIILPLAPRKDLTIHNLGLSMLKMTLLVSLAVGILAVYWAWPYLSVRLRFRANRAQGRYWHHNELLRRNCVRPRNQQEFAVLLELAEQADRKKALAYIARETEEYYNRLIDERNLNMGRLIRGSLDREILSVRDDVNYDVEEPVSEEGAGEMEPFPDVTRYT